MKSDTFELKIETINLNESQRVIVFGIIDKLAGDKLIK